MTVYPGEPGLRSFQRMQEMERAFNRFEMPNQLKVQEHLLSLLCIQCSLVNRDMLLAADKETETALAPAMVCSYEQEADHNNEYEVPVRDLAVVTGNKPAVDLLIKYAASIFVIECPLPRRAAGIS